MERPPAPAPAEAADRIAALEALLNQKDAENAELRSTVAELQSTTCPSSPKPACCSDQHLCPFGTLREMFRSKAFIVYAANELHKAYCALEGCVYAPINQHQKERIGCCWACIPAADAVVHQMAFQRMMTRTNPEPPTATVQSDTRKRKLADAQGALLKLDDLNIYLEEQGSEGADLLAQDYLSSLRQLASAANLSCEQVYLAVNCCHLGFRSGLPFRQMQSTDYGPLMSKRRNKPVCYLTQLDREKSFTLVCKAAQLIARYLDNWFVGSLEATATQGPTGAGVGVFLGGSCNPTTWRKDIAIPLLDAAGSSYYNPQVDSWTPELVDIEAQAKTDASVLLFVIDRQTRALASMIEASEYVSTGRKIVLVIQEVAVGTVIGSGKVDEAEAKDLNRARSYLRDVASRHEVSNVYDDIPEAIQAVVSMNNAQ